MNPWIIRSKLAGPDDVCQMNRKRCDGTFMRSAAMTFGERGHPSHDDNSPEAVRWRSHAHMTSNQKVMTQLMLQVVTVFLIQLSCVR